MSHKIHKPTPIYLLDLKATNFSLPVKRIFDSQTTQDFQSSIALQRLRFFLQRYIELVANVEIPPHPDSYVSEILMVNSIIHLLNELSTIVQDTPPLKGPRRYGNLACRDWHSKIEVELPKLLEKAIPSPDLQPSIIELNYYIANSFGSSTRLDYGTGHELSFMAFIAALDMLGLFPDLTGKDLLIMFNAYYSLVRELILTYTLEPAGSHGVWGLDDHFHLAYILGSSQWLNNAPLTPKEITNSRLVKDYSTKNLYCQCIEFVLTVKSGPFAEHSPILYDISTSVSAWRKVQRGLIKMYMDEVLNKFPVVQHFWFGTGFYPWINFQTLRELPVYEHSPEDDDNNNNNNNNNNNLVQRSSSSTSTVTSRPLPHTSTAFPQSSGRMGSTKLPSMMGSMTSPSTRQIGGMTAATTTTKMARTTMPPPTTNFLTRPMHPSNTRTTRDGTSSIRSNVNTNTINKNLKNSQ
ncbi:peptidylprolyl isomerase RRD1 NDAI_0F00240 [Naumovozyma dairenensis CBS 421]|uniref:Serine/threonine-protein phosphatase 2A activator n=1 Tax=Naumovozyma dairenensis (strain ATCC 10597 / BCRC 20456 / CBS 421 / NBRC 0211 / NRRL Y-12639) TaxID=1071378 RepID=G0WC32_NAUDC|nr:hypothetical protein NDAI_0F00240 [Naumovozyma dairenensis CBS 421]CCD25343.1 hypothetical protein NDAI_0F00240 [Naumovozyma dairenensis CBS 421]